jgi:hypothetical protein
MRGNSLLTCCFLAFFLIGPARPALAQQEVYHPGETYDSLQAGQDAYLDAEAQRRALIGRQIMIEDQIMQQNTWADPQDKYRPVRPESYGPVLPKVHAGPTWADVYAYPTDGGPVYYGGTPPPAPTPGGSPPRIVANTNGSYAAPVPVFQPWPRVPNDIWGTPYYGYVRQPIGHVKIWTGRLSYIYKPIYASPPQENPLAAAASARAAASPPRRQSEPGSSPAYPPPAAAPSLPPPPPKPAFPRSGRPTPKSDAGPDGVPPPPVPPQAGQEL